MSFCVSRFSRDEMHKPIPNIVEKENLGRIPPYPELSGDIYKFKGPKI